MIGLVTAGAGAKTAMSMLAMLAIQGTVLAIVAALVLRVVGRRPGLAAAVWLVVLAKFAVPFMPALPWSLADLIAHWRHTEVGPVSFETAKALGPEPAASIYPALGWLALAAVWALGTLLVLARALAAHRATVAAARAAADAPAEARALLAELAVALRVRTPRLAVGAAEIGPHVVGLLRTTIVVPPALLGDHALLRAALLHELAHVRRKDALARVLQIWATAVFFWWPAVRLASRRLDAAREAACDAWALEAAGVSRPAYARLLVRMAGLRVAAASSLAASSGRVLDARVAAVLGPPARARVGWIGKLAVLGWAALSLGGARTAAARGEPNVCLYTPQLAEALRQAHPEADLDGDGQLSRDEACELQAEIRRRVETGEPQMSTLPDASRSAELDRLLEGPLCCNCGAGDGLIPTTGAAASCSVND